MDNDFKWSAQANVFANRKKQRVADFHDNDDDGQQVPDMVRR